MKIMKKFVMLFFVLFSVSFLAGCGNTVKKGVSVDLTYTVMDANTSDIILSGEKNNVKFDFDGSDLFHLLEGAKEGDVRSGILEDPFNEYNPELMYKQTVFVLEEMGVPVEIGGAVSVGDDDMIITDIFTENGIDQVSLDGNPLELLFPYKWNFEVKSIY